MLKNIHYLEVRIEPFIYRSGAKTLNIKIRVNGELLNHQQYAFEDNDFEDRFHLLMRTAEEEIRRVVSE